MKEKQKKLRRKALEDLGGIDLTTRTAVAGKGYIDGGNE